MPGTTLLAQKRTGQVQTAGPIFGVSRGNAAVGFLCGRPVARPEHRKPARPGPNAHPTAKVVGQRPVFRAKTENRVCNFTISTISTKHKRALMGPQRDSKTGCAGARIRYGDLHWKWRRGTFTTHCPVKKENNKGKERMLICNRTAQSVRFVPTNIQRTT